MKPIRLSHHAHENARFRGATETQVQDAIRTAPWEPAELGRLQCRKEFPFNQDWNGKFYTTKRVRPVFADNPEEIVVVTVYVYFF